MGEIKCNLIIDSCCDLPASVVDVPGVELLNFPYLVDGVEHIDDLYKSITAQEFYDSMRKGAEPSTAQVPILAITEAFTRAVESGIPTVCLIFSSALSGTCGTAMIIRDQILADHEGAELYVIDTKLASIAEGMLIYEAIQQRERGLSARELAQWAEEARYYINEQFMVDDLDALRRGGRIPASVAFAGAKLDVKPMLDISQDGHLSLTGVARGRKKGIRKLAEFYAKNTVATGCGDRVIIGHADCPKDVERLKSELHKIDDSLLILECSIGPVIGSHVGPGMIALAFMGNDGREDLSVSDRIANKVRSND